MKLKIGNVEIENNVLLAPMAGITDMAFRKIAKKYGNPGMVCTEMASSKAIFYGDEKTDKIIRTEGEKRPIAIQIFGSEPEVMADTAKKVAKYADIIDINMGCPVPKVAVGAQAGAALLKNPEKIYDIVKSVKESVPIPVTVKIRSGWDDKSINAKEVAILCEKAGASAICIHPRTRSQRYEGLSNWKIIKEVKASVNIPVIGNGDIKSVYDAKRMIEETGCDAVMIGRAALGNPWLIKDIVNYLNKGILPKEIEKNEKIEMCFKHLNYLLEFKPEKTAVLEMRSHIAWYLKGLEGSNEIKRKIFNSNTKEEIIKILNEYKKEK